MDPHKGLGKAQRPGGGWGSLPVIHYSRHCNKPSIGVEHSCPKVNLTSARVLLREERPCWQPRGSKGMQ